MTPFQRIDVEQAMQLLERDDCQLLDIRDEQSFRLGHIRGARHLDGETVQDFIRDANPDAPLVIYCYHGNSSQQAAMFFHNNQFSDVYSVDGGYEVWQQRFPESTRP